MSWICSLRSYDFGGDHLDNSFHECIVSASVWDSMLEVEGDHRVVLLRKESNDDMVVLRARSHVALTDSEILLPRWVMKALDIPFAGLVSIEIIPNNSIQPVDAPTIQLLFQGYYNETHWDDLTMPDMEFNPHHIIPRWPTGLSTSSVVPLLNRMLTALNPALILINGCLVVVQVLQLKLVLRVSLECASAILIQRQGNLQILTNEMDSRTESSKDEQLQTLPCLAPLLFQLQLKLVSEASRWNAHSTLICGASGCGKSSLLTLFELTAKENPCVKVIRLSAKKVYSRLLRSLDTLYARLDGASILDLVNELVGLCFGPNESVIENSSQLAVVLLIDELDVILATSDEGQEEYSIERNQIDPEILLMFTATLAKLLQKLAFGSPFDRSSCVYVIGATRRPATLLPRQHTGSPEFEEVRSFPRLSFEDREILLQQMLSKYSQSFRFEPIQNLNVLPNIGNELVEDTILIKQWANNLAGLSAGYVAGDITRLVDNIIRFHETVKVDGSELAMNQPHSESMQFLTAEPDFAIRWSTALAALGASPPIALADIVGAQNVMDRNAVAVSWDDFGGYEPAKAQLQRLLSALFPRYGKRIHENSTRSAKIEAIANGLEESSSTRLRGGDALSMYTALPRAGIVLHGPSGCGKSYLASIIAKEVGVNLITIKATELLSKYFGQTEATIRRMFQQARAAAPSLLLIEDFDVISIKRDADNGHGSDLNSRILSTFLNELDGVVEENVGDEGGILVIATCLDLGSLDEALIRPGRLHYHIPLNYPTDDDILRILELQLRAIPVAADVRTEDVAACVPQTRRRTGAVISGFCRRAVEQSLQDHIRQLSLPSTEEFNESIPSIPSGMLTVRLEHFQAAASQG